MLAFYSGRILPPGRNINTFLALSLQKGSNFIIYLYIQLL